MTSLADMCMETKALRAAADVAKGTTMYSKMKIDKIDGGWQDLDLSCYRATPTQAHSFSLCCVRHKQMPASPFVRNWMAVFLSFSDCCGYPIQSRDNQFRSEEKDRP